MRRSGDAADPGRLSVLFGWLIVVAVLLSALPLGSNRPAGWVMLSAFSAILFSLHVVFAWRSPRGAALLLPVSTLMAMTLTWLAVQALYPAAAPLAHPLWATVGRDIATISADPVQTFHILSRLAAYAMIFWLVQSAARDPAMATRMMMLIGIGVSLVAAYGLIAWFAGYNPITQATNDTVVTATFINRNHFATYAVFGLLANLGAYVHMTGGSGRHTKHALRDVIEGFFSGAWVFGLGVLICLSGILLSQSRGGAVAALVGVFCFLGLYGGRRASRLGLIAVAALMAFSVVALSSGTLSRMLLTDSEEGRLLIFPAVLDGIAARPWVGHGAGAFHETFRVYKPADLAVVEVDFAHSSYLEAAYEFGIPAALLFYAALMILCLGIALKGMSRRRYRSVPLFAASAAAAASVHAMVDFSLQIPAVAALFAALLGLGWAQAFRPRSGRSSETP